VPIQKNTTMLPESTIGLELSILRTHQTQEQLTKYYIDSIILV